MTQLRKQLTVAATLVALFAAATAVQAQGYGYRGYGRDTGNEFRFRGGVFTPQGGGDYWNNTFKDFTGSRSDFQGGAVGFDYLHQITPFLSLNLGTSYYYADHDQRYRNFEDENGRSIIHTTRLQTASFDAGLLLRLAPRPAPVVPYIGGGGTVVSYELEEEGDFVDVDSTPHQIFTDRFHSRDVATGWYAVAGLEFPISRGFSIFGEGRWQEVHATLRDDFDGFGTLNLNGVYAMVGAAWRF